MIIHTLHRYILRNLLVGLAVGSVALVVLIWLINSLKFLDWFVNKGLSVATFLRLTLLLMPGFLTVFIPIALFAVVLFTYNRLAADRELIVMRAAGMGPWQLARPALVLCAVLTGVGYWLTLSVVPTMEGAFEAIKFEVRGEVSSLVIKEGQFNQMKDGLIVYAGERAKDGRLIDLMIHDTTGKTSDLTVMAESGALVREGEGARLLLINGNRQERNRQTGKVNFLYFDSYAVDLGGKAASTEMRFREERERPLSELISLKAGDRIDPDYPFTYEERHIRRMRMEAHLRLLRPLAHIGFLLIGLAAVLTGEFDRRGGNKRVILAVALVVLFQAGSLGAATVAKKSLDGLLLLDLMTLLPILVGWIWLVWPSERWGRRRLAPRRGRTAAPALTGGARR
ncbi:LPS export ABC transporter permease LptF [Rhodospirillum rubrum]|uniref:LPS export ABC transporter permease LptF n=1 Tax=Rhodospirillum rubrum TaxID=1085 RepID=UPI001904AB3D|nr:LPS export ABC transporter permease LptF [Rhodospirillum rubrum]MBK1664496.1 LPS export ABC transporter permease LptF [Rhodospirillum rubrum]MBK1676247.1 LPS export ABC transporter permease LptF [Rhodospirillum rubrum]